MDYAKLYERIIANIDEIRPRPSSLAMTLPGFEMHHVIAKCDGGSNKGDNLVYLTHREHVTLSIIYAKSRKYETIRPMFSAFYIINTSGIKVSPVVFEMSRRMHIEGMAIFAKQRDYPSENLKRTIDRLLHPEKYKEAYKRGVQTQYSKYGPDAFKKAGRLAYQNTDDETRLRMKHHSSNSIRNMNERRRKFPWKVHNGRTNLQLWSMADQMHDIMMGSDTVLGCREIVDKLEFDRSLLGKNMQQVYTMQRWFSNYGDPRHCPEWLEFRENIHNGHL